MLTGILIGFAGAYAMSGVLMTIIISLDLIQSPTLETLEGDRN